MNDRLWSVVPRLREDVVTGITPTGDRPLAFELCKRWLAKQTRKLDQWIVIDDGHVPLTPTEEMTYVRRPPSDGGPTLHLNLLAALELVKGGSILVLEDDEYYAPGYVARMADELKKVCVAGIGRSRYYHVPSGGYFAHANMGHASLAQTGLRDEFLPQFKETLLERQATFIDTRLWVRAPKRSRSIFYDRVPLYVGMKGMPGRSGIGIGHRKEKYLTFDDGDRMLKAWVPLDCDVYRAVRDGRLTESNVDDFFKERERGIR